MIAGLDGVIEAHNPVGMTADEAVRGEFTRKGYKFSFDPESARILDACLRGRCGDGLGIRILRPDECGERFSPETGMFDLLEGELPDTRLDFARLTPFFRGRMAMLSPKEDFLLYAALSSYGIEGGFTASDFTRDMMLSCEANGEVLSKRGLQQVVAQTFDGLVNKGVFVPIERKGRSKKSYRVKSVPFAAWSLGRASTGPQAWDILRKYNDVDALSPHVVPPIATRTVGFAPSV